MKVTDFIKKLIADGVSQSDVARKCDLSNSIITKYLYSNVKPTIETIYKVANAYGVDPAIFIQAEVPAQHVKEEPPPYAASLTDDQRAILEMLKDDPDLARRARRFVQFEKQANAEDIANQKKVA